jgi:hypothetical protein
MKCSEARESLLEYVEGSLPEVRRGQFDAHVTGCDACAEAVRREREIAARLSKGFRESVERVTLGEGGKEKLTQLLANAPGHGQPRWTQLLAERWIVLTTALSTGVALIAVLLWFGNPHHAKPKTQPLAVEPDLTQMPETRPTIQIRLQYLARSYTFQRKGEFVVDTLVEQTNLVNVTLGGQITESIQPKANEKKMPL